MKSATPKLFVIYRLSIWIPTPFRFREACNSLLLVGSVSRRECLMNPRSLLLLLLCVSLFYACFPHFVRISCLRRTKHFLTNYLCPPFFFFFLFCLWFTVTGLAWPPATSPITNSGNTPSSQREENPESGILFQVTKWLSFIAHINIQQYFYLSAKHRLVR